MRVAVRGVVMAVDRAGNRLRKTRGTHYARAPEGACAGINHLLARDFSPFRIIYPSARPFLQSRSSSVPPLMTSHINQFCLRVQLLMRQHL